MNEPATSAPRDPRLTEIERKQDRLLRELDQLNERIESALAGMPTAPQA